MLFAMFPGKRLAHTQARVYMIYMVFISNVGKCPEHK